MAPYRTVYVASPGLGFTSGIIKIYCYFGDSCCYLYYNMHIDTLLIMKTSRTIMTSITFSCCYHLCGCKAYFAGTLVPINAVPPAMKPRALVSVLP